MFFYNVKRSNFNEEKRHVPKRTDEVLAPMNMHALKNHVKNLENKQKTAQLITSLFLSSLEVKTANTSTKAKVANG